MTALQDFFGKYSNKTGTQGAPAQPVEQPVSGLAGLNQLPKLPQGGFASNIEPLLRSQGMTESGYPVQAQPQQQADPMGILVNKLVNRDRPLNNDVIEQILRMIG